MKNVNEKSIQAKDLAKELGFVALEDRLEMVQLSHLAGTACECECECESPRSSEVADC